MAMRNDVDPVETREWLDALDSVLAFEGTDRARFLLGELATEGRKRGAPAPYSATTPYLNTIPVDQQPAYPGDLATRARRSAPSSAGTPWPSCCGRTRSPPSWAGTSPASSRRPPCTTSASTTSGTRPRAGHGGDLIYFQGHISPGIYARSFLEGRLTEDAARPVPPGGRRGGLSSYPHPWLMPDYWQFPTVSMGLGPLMAIYQARFLKYLGSRGLADTANRKVWAFLGDGETDEPESLGAISLGGRERLDNLIFVVNCNLQRLDGPVRGNGKIIQELEGVFRGAGWNVIKVIWGSALGRAAGQGHHRPAAAADGGVRRRPVPGLQVQERRLRPRALLRRLPRAGRAGRRHDRRRDLEPQPRRPRPGQGVRRLRGRGPPHRPADGDPGQDGQGLRHGRGRRGPEHHPPAEEDGRGRPEGVPGPLRPVDPRRPAARLPLPAAGRRQPGGRATSRSGAPALGGDLPARRRRSESLAVPELPRSGPSWPAPATARSPPPWRSCAS